MVSQASRLQNVRYDIRGPVLQRARQLEAQGYRILKLNLGNPAHFGIMRAGGCTGSGPTTCSSATAFPSSS